MLILCIYSLCINQFLTKGIVQNTFSCLPFSPAPAWVCLLPISANKNIRHMKNVQGSDELQYFITLQCSCHYFLVLICLFAKLDISCCMCCFVLVHLVQTCNGAVETRPVHVPAMVEAALQEVSSQRRRTP